MSIVDKLKKLLKMNREIPPEAAQVKELSERIVSHADSLTKQLQVYQRSRDPFAAMLADVYNQGQMSRLHRSIMR